MKQRIILSIILFSAVLLLHVFSVPRYLRNLIVGASKGIGFVTINPQGF